MDPVKAISVFVVHPDVPTAEGIARAISDIGLDVQVFADGERAIDRFVVDPCTVLVVELALPGRDGGATVESIRWAPRGDKVRVMLTATGGTSAGRLDEVARRIGAARTFRSPIDPDAIADAVRQIVEESDALTRVAHAESEAALAGSLPAFEPDAFKEELSTDVEEEGDAPWTSGDDPSAELEGVEVERSISEIDKTEEGLEGTLTDTSFPRLLQKLGEARATGALALTAPEDDRETTTGEPPRKVLFFRNGLPAYVKSNLVRECLGQVLVRSGRISAEQRNESIKRMRAGAGRQGAILLDMGVLTPHDLREALEEQLRVKLFDLFAWRRGDYRFSSRVLPPPEIVTLDLALPEIVFEGIVRSIPPGRLLELLAPHLDAYVVPTRERVARFLHLDLVREARALLLSLDGTQRLRDLLAGAGKRPGAAAQLLYAMSCMEAVAFDASPSPVKPVDPPDGKLEDELSSPGNMTALREELERIARLLKTERWNEALGLTDPSTEDIRSTVARLRQRYRALTMTGSAPRDLRQLAAEVRARLDQAERTLTTRAATELRASTRVARPGSGSGPVPGEAPPAVARAASGAKPVLDDDDSEDSITDPTGARARTPRPSLADDEAAEDTLDEQAASDLGMGQGGLDRALDRADAAPPSTPPPPASGDASGLVPPPEPALDQQVDRLFRAERHFRRGERALHRSKIMDALVAFRRAVELCPDEGQFVAHLGWAEHLSSPEDPDVSRTALVYLARACELAPKLDLAHLFRARVLAVTGDLRGARDSYERALAANPDCREALDGLRALSQGIGATR